MRENRTHGSIGGRWRSGTDLRGPLVPGRQLEHAATMAWSGPQPQRAIRPSQRPTSPLLAYLDATGEALAGLLRPGNAGSGTAADHVAVLDDALAQLPIDPGSVEVIARVDSAGWSHGFVNHCRDRRVRFVIGHQLTIDIANVLVNVPERAWRPAISADGSELREHAEVIEITDHVDLSAWPQGCRRPRTRTR